MKKGFVHVYTGDGKGKSTAATGLATRAAGQGLKVAFFQFMKNGISGETVSLAKLGVEVFSPQGKGKFIWEMDAEEKAEYAKKQAETLERAIDMAPDFDLLVLDEAVCAMDAELIDSDKLFAFLRERPAGLEVVLTGRCKNEELEEQLIGIADYCTEMGMVCHPFEDGQDARRGIEF